MSVEREKAQPPRGSVSGQWSADGRPTFQRRIGRAMLIGPAVAGVVQIAWMAWFFATIQRQTAPRIGPFLAVLGVLVVGIFGFTTVQAVRWRRAVGRARRLGFRLCSVCLYDLSGVMPEGDDDAPFRCPECGAALTMTAMRAAWTDGARAR